MNVTDQQSIVTYEQTLAQLQTALKELRHKEADIAFQIDQARARAREQGEYAPRTWYRRAMLALRKTRADIDWQQRSIKQLERRQSYLHQTRLEHQFVQIARQRMSSNMFDDFMHEAVVITSQMPSANIVTINKTT